MGKYLDTWMQTQLPRIQQILMPRPTTIGPGAPQPEGATTFPAPPPSRVMGQQMDPNTDLPMGDMGPVGPFAPQAPPTPTFGQAVRPSPQQPTTQGPPAGMQAGGPGQPVQPTGGAAATFQPPEVQSRHKPTDIKDIKTVDDLMPAIDDKTMLKAYNTIEGQLGGPEQVDRHIYQITGNDPGALNKREKTELMLEFGLRLASAGSPGANEGAGGNVANAALGTLGSMRTMRQNKQIMAANESDRAEKAREADLRASLLKQQIEKAKGDKYQLKTDKDGRLVRIDMNTGTSQLVLGEDKNPVMANENTKEFASVLDRQAYEGAFCEGLDGDAKKACQQRALIFSKGGAPELAFPEYTRTKISDRLMTMMENPDNKRTKYTLPNGTVKPYSEMSGDEKLQAASVLIDRWTDLAHTKLGERTTAKPAPANNWGLSKDDLGSIKENEKVTLDNGTVLTRRGGKIVQLDAKGNPILTKS